MQNRLPLPPAAPIALHRQFRFQWEPAQDSFVLLYPEGMIKLRGSAGEIMQRVDGRRSLDDIVRELEAAFPGMDLRADVVEFLEIAHANSWIHTKQDR